MNLNNSAPLAAQLRPQTLLQFIGQEHLLAPGKPLRSAIEQGRAHSMILWGPPGTGKTTLAKILAERTGAEIKHLSAVSDGVKDIRAAITHAQELLKQDIRTIFFVDEVHRFSKSQQDVFLPYIENGTIIFIGATTENPSFALNNALLSRARVYVLKSLTEADLLRLIQQALSHISVAFPEEFHSFLAQAADGDARRCLNLLQIAAELAESQNSPINLTILEAVLSEGVRRFDKQGEDFYDQISALHKSMRGSAPDAALYWLARMMDGGCDPYYILRRLVRFASEDIGNADPRALDITLSAWHSYERLGSPEGDLALAQAVVFLAVSAKSNAIYTAWNQVKADITRHGSLEIPLHLRNAPTNLMKELGYAKKYRYAHDEPNAYAAGENYMPEGLKGKQYYYPTDRGLELKIREKLVFLKELDKK